MTGKKKFHMSFFSPIGFGPGSRSKHSPVIPTDEKDDSWSSSLPVIHGLDPWMTKAAHWDNASDTDDVSVFPPVGISLRNVKYNAFRRNRSSHRVVRLNWPARCFARWFSPSRAPPGPEIRDGPRLARSFFPQSGTYRMSLCYLRTTLPRPQCGAREFRYQYRRQRQRPQG